MPFRQGRSPVEKPGRGSRTCRAQPGKRRGGSPSLWLLSLTPGILPSALRAGFAVRARSKRTRGDPRESDSGAEGGRKPLLCFLTTMYVDSCGTQTSTSHPKNFIWTSMVHSRYVAWRAGNAKSGSAGRTATNIASADSGSRHCDRWAHRARVAVIAAGAHLALIDEARQRDNLGIGVSLYSDFARALGATGNGRPSRAAKRVQPH